VFWVILLSEAGSLAQAPPPPKITILTYNYETKGIKKEANSKDVGGFIFPSDANIKDIYVKFQVDPKGPAVVGLYLQQFNQSGMKIGEELKMAEPICLDPPIQSLWKATIPAGTMPPSSIWKVHARVNRPLIPTQEDTDEVLIATAL
jgi:hypothetical protein